MENTKEKGLKITKPTHIRTDRDYGSIYRFAWVWARWCPSVDGRSGHKPLALTMKLSSNDNHSKVCFLPQSQGGHKQLLREDSMSSRR